MLENLTDRLSRVVKTMRGQARLTESNTAEMLREIRLALLEADVALPVVKSLMEQIKFKALGEDVIGSLTPGQALVGVVQRELSAIMGGAEEDTGKLNLATQPPAVILMAGLQGAGKTTSVAKLAKFYKTNIRKTFLRFLATSTDPQQLNNSRRSAVRWVLIIFQALPIKNQSRLQALRWIGQNVTITTCS